MEKWTIALRLFAAIFGTLIFGQINKGKLNITTTPAGAHIVIDDEDSGITPAIIKLDARQYDIRITAQGYRTIEQKNIITPHKTTSLTFNLVPESKEDMTTR